MPNNTHIASLCFFVQLEHAAKRPMLACKCLSAQITCKMFSLVDVNNFKSNSLDAWFPPNCSHLALTLNHLLAMCLFSFTIASKCPLVFFCVCFSCFQRWRFDLVLDL